MKNLFFLLAVAMLIELTAHAQPGSLDPTFGNGGKVTTDVGGGNDVGIALAIQSDGKLVMTGYTELGLDKDVAVVRYNDDGSLDNTFGNGGKVTTAVGIEDDNGTAIAIQNDGKIVVAGSTNIGSHNNFAVIRYNTDGSLDNTFGSGGKVVTAVTDFGNLAYSVAIQGDNKIIAAGFADDQYSDFFALVRYKTDGTLDSTFGTFGKVTTHVGASDDQIYSVKIQSDGKIVAGGYSYNGNNWDFAIVRYTTDGSLDNTFGGDGIVTTPMGTSDAQCYAVAIQDDGKIVGAGWNMDYFVEYAVARYNTDGGLDNTFGVGGKVSTAIGGIQDDADAVAIQTDGNIVVGGSAQNGTDDDFGIVRYNSDGTPDSAFGTFGIVTTVFGNSNDVCLAMGIQSDHKIVAAGYTGANGTRDFAVARFDAGAVGINEAATQNSILLYPNPFITELIVRGTSASGELIFNDVLGNEILRQQTSSSETKINTEKLFPGIYLLKYKSGTETKNLRAMKF